MSTDAVEAVLVLPHYLRPPAPSVFTLEVTRRCYHHCIGCGNVFAHGDGELGRAAWSDILDRLRPNVRALRITGGEPTLHSDFESLVQLLDDQGVPFVLFTNGNWSDPIGYYRFTGVDAFSTVTANIRRAADAGLTVATNTLLLETTFRRLTAVIDLALSLGVSTVSFGRYYGRPLPGLSLSAEQLRAVLSEIAMLRQEEPRVLLSNCVPLCFLADLDVGARGCTSGFTHCTIGPSGEVRPCTHSTVVLGSILQLDIETLWQSAALDAWRRLVPDQCLACAALSRCRGGCRATAQQLALAHDPLIRDPLDDPGSLPIISLDARARPRLVCDLSPAPYGYALSGVGHFVTLSFASGPILQALDGQWTVDQIREQFGPAALQLVGSLAQKRLVELDRAYEPKPGRHL